MSNTSFPGLLANNQDIPATIKRTICSRIKTSNTNDTSLSTNILLQLYRDRIFVVISQYGGKIGTLLQVTMENSIIDNSKTYNVSTLLGSKRNDVILDIYARQLLEVIESSTACKPSQLVNHDTQRILLLGISLRDMSQEIFHHLIKEVMIMYEQAIENLDVSA